MLRYSKVIQTFIFATLSQDVVISLTEVLVLVGTTDRFRLFHPVRYFLVLLSVTVAILTLVMLLMFKQFVKRCLLDVKMNRFLQFRL